MMTLRALSRSRLLPIVTCGGSMRVVCRSVSTRDRTAKDIPFEFVSTGLWFALTSDGAAPGRAAWIESWDSLFAFVVDFEGGGDGDGVLSGSEDASDAGIVLDDEGSHFRRWGRR